MADNDIRELSRQLSGVMQRKQTRLETAPGELGNGYGAVAVAGREHYVYCRVGGTIAEVFNNRVPAENNLLVMVGYDPAQPDLYQVLSTRTTTPGGTTGGAVAGYAPAIRYQWMATGGGQDPLYVEKRQSLPRRIGPLTGMLLQVYRDIVWTGMAWKNISTQNFSLAAYVPQTTGKAAFVLITIDDTGAVVKTKGSEVALAALALSDIPAVPAGTREVLGAVRVYTGQTAIQEARTNTDIVDLRFGGWNGAEASDLPDHEHSGDAGDGGQFDAANLSSGAATDGYVLTADGAGGAAWEPGGGGIVEYASTNVSNPPTQEQINAAFGAPFTVGQGFLGLLNDSGLGLREYLCASDGSKWLYTPFSVAASGLGYASLTRYGIVITALESEDNYLVEPNVMIEDGLWKMWAHGGWSEPHTIVYATSPDGLTWTRYASNPVLTGYVCPYVFKIGTTYHLYAADPEFLQIDHYTSTDGLAWTLSAANVLPRGGAGAWDAGGLGNLYVWQAGENDWRLLYEGWKNWTTDFIGKIGYATSTDGNTWTKSASNPVISETGWLGGPHIYEHDDTYYLWLHRATSSNLPTDIARYHSSDLVTWTFDGVKVNRTGADEGEGSSVGQVADPYIVVHNGVMYLYYEGSIDGATGAGSNLKVITGKESLIWE